MPISETIVDWPVRVRYAETDASGLVHHASYWPWLESGRVAWLNDQGVSYRELEDDGYHLAVVQADIRYVAPARFDDLLVVRTALVDGRSREATFRYEVVTRDEPARQVANASTRHICLRYGSVAKLPESVRRLLL